LTALGRRIANTKLLFFFLIFSGGGDFQIPINRISIFPIFSVFLFENYEIFLMQKNRAPRFFSSAKSNPGNLPVFSIGGQFVVGKTLK